MKRIIVITALLIACLSLKADVQHKKIEKTFKLKKMKQLIVQNSYGQIELEQWDKDIVEIKVDIKVDAGNAQKVKAILDKIDVSFIQKVDYLSVVTGFSEGFSISKFVNKFFSSGSVQIDYSIYIPKSMELKLVNSHGNVFLGDFAATLDIDIEKGDLKLGNSLGKSSISVKKGSVDINRLDKSNCIFVDCKEVNIKKVETINIDSKHSDINIESAKSIVITSSRGDCKFGTVSSLRGSSSMTDYEVKDVGSELVFDMWFGSLNVRNIHNMFSLVDVKSERAKTGLTFMQGAAYDIRIRHNKSVKIQLPIGIEIKKRNTAEKRVFVSEGKYGGENRFNSKVTISAKNCKLFIQ